MGDRRFLHADDQGSIIAATDGSGAGINTMRYNEYGIGETSQYGRFGYTGQAWLPEVGLYWYKARVYSPQLGRFLQTDPVGYAAGPNWYNYVGGDPVNGTDPSGLFRCEKCTWKNDPPRSADSTVDAEIGVLASRLRSGRPLEQELAITDVQTRLLQTVYFNISNDKIIGDPQNEEDKSTIQKAKQCASQQLGLDDLADAGAAIAGFNLLETRGKLAGAVPGTSIASKSASALFGSTRLPFRLPTLVGNPLALSVGIRATSSVARIVGRGIPVVGWGLLAYDAAKIAQCVANED